MTIKYWPKQQGADLNREVSSLFKKSYIKATGILHNNTSFVLSVDIIASKIKTKLFTVVLLELEVLILDIIDLNLRTEEVKFLSKKIFSDLVLKSTQNFLSMTTSGYLTQEKLKRFCNVVSDDHNFILECLLLFLIFGAETSNRQSYLFIEFKVPVKYVEVLLDNLTIYIAHIIFLEIILYKLSLVHLFELLISNDFCGDSRISLRSLATFKNNLIWQHFVDTYFIQPRLIYNNCYRVWIFSSQGLLPKYVYSRRRDNIKLSNLQIFVVILIEIQDFLWPKMQYLCVSLSRIFVYFTRDFVGRVFKFVSKMILDIMRIKHTSTH